MKIKEFIDVMLKDYAQDDFSDRECVIYGIIAPLLFVGVLAIVATIQTLFAL